MFSAGNLDRPAVLFQRPRPSATAPEKRAARRGKHPERNLSKF